MPQLYTRRNIIIAFIIIAAVVLYFVFFTYRNNREAVHEARRVNESLQSLRILENLMDDMQDIETGQRGYIISRNSYFLAPYNEGLARLHTDTGAVRNLYEIYPQRIAVYERLLSWVRQKISRSAETIGHLKEGKSDSAYFLVQSGRGKIIMDSIRAIVSRMEDEDRIVLRQSNVKRQEAASSSAGYLMALVILCLVVLVWLLWQLFRGESVQRENRKQIAHLARLTEQASDAIFSVDKKGVILSWNAGAEKLYGYKKEEVIGKYAPDITRSGYSPEMLGDIASAIPQYGHKTIEGVSYNKSGKAIECLVSVSGIFGERNEMTGYVMVVRDISERKKSEKLLTRFNEELSRQVEEKTELVRNIVGRIRDGFFSLDNNWRFTFANDYMLEMTGRKAEDLIGKNFWDAFPDVSGTVAKTHLLDAMGEQRKTEYELFYPPMQKWFSSIVYPSPTGLSVLFRDVTAIKKAEEESRRSSERLYLISRTTNDAIWEWDLETGQMWGNETHQEYYGLKATDPVPSEEEWHNRIHPDDRDWLIKKQEDALASDTNIFITEYRFRTNKEGYRNIYDRCYIVRNEKGKAIRMLGSMMDVTERKKAEEALQQSEAKYRAYFENSLDGIMLTSPEGKIYAANPAACAIFGMTEKEICEAGRNGLSDLSDPRLNELIETRKRTGIARGEVTLVRKNGEKFPAEVSSAIFSDATGSVRTSMIIRDITERKKAEQQLESRENHLRTILNTEPECIKLLGPDGQLLEMNPAGLAMIEADNLEMVQHKSVLGIIEPEYREAFSQLIKDVFNGKPGKLSFAIRGFKGTHRWLDTHAVPMKDEKGTIVSLLGITRDVTEKRKAELAIISSEETRRLIMNSALDAIVCIDKNGLVTVWTPQAEKIFGWNESEIIGHALTDTIIPQHYRERHKAGMKRYIETGEGPVLNRLMEISAVNRAGNEFPIELSIIPVKQGDTEFFCAFIRDITERKKAELALKESEEKLRHILASTADDFYVIDNSYRVILINRTAQVNLEQVWGYKVTTGTYMPDIFPEKRKEFIIHNYDLVFKGERVEYEIPVMIGDKEYWRRVHYGPVRNQEGIITGAFITTSDITERKKAEEDILRTNARFQIMSKATSDIVWDLDIQRNTLWWNDNYYQNLGYQRNDEQVDLEDWFTHIHPEDRDRVRQKFFDAISGTASAWRDEYRYRKEDGNYLHMLDRGYIMRDNESKAFRMIGSMVDMTPIYEVQRKVIESENRIRTILDTDPECIMLVDELCCVQDINKAGLDMIEAEKPEQVAGITLLRVVGEHQREAITGLIGESFRGNSGRTEFQMLTLKGNKRWCEVNIVPFRNAENKIVNALAVTRDISEKKEAEMNLIRNEEKYRTLVEQAVDAIALYDAEGKILDVNTGSVNLLGYSREELLGMHLKDVLTNEEIRASPVRYDVLASGQSTVKQRKMRRKDGSIVDTEVRSQQLPDGRFLSVIRDLTERIRAEQELQESYRALRELTAHLQNIREEERSNIAREIHDELGQQLTVLKMDISWLSKKMENPDEKVQERLNSLLEMIDNTVRSVRRISAELRPSMLDDLGLPAAIEWHSQEFGKRSGLRIRTQMETSDLKLPEKTGISLFRVFQESLTNVARHSGASEVMVRLFQKDKRLHLEISDNGKGFLQKEIERKKTLGILGIRERVSLIRGEYFIESKPGNGTKVRVSVPIPEVQ